MAYNPNDFFSLYRFLSPSDLSSAIADLGGRATLTKQNFLDEMMRLMLNPNGQFVEGEMFKKKVADLYASNNGSKEAKKIYLHVISTDGIVDIGDTDYWGNVKKLSDISPVLTSDKAKVTVVSTRSPYLNPGRRGTQAVEFFLNYIPTHVASNMVPYLELEFELTRGASFAKGTDSTNKNFFSTPSIQRFLLGSIDSSVATNISDADKALNRVAIKDAVTKTGDVQDSRAVAYSGMEMFLSPQTLSNMGSLGANGSRLVPVKPFVPFMSIESMQITIRNAGSGMMAHKTAQLKIKVHDKARISEIAEFVRGPVGFREAIIWSTYGWLAPRSLKTEEDGYAKFINENMITTDCWQVSNAQFGFDAAGQVSLSLELVSKGVTALQGAHIALDGDNMQSNFRTLRKCVQEISRLRNELFPEDNSSPFNVEARAIQVLNEGANGTIINLDPTKLGKAIEEMKKTLLKNGSLDKGKVNELIGQVRNLYQKNDQNKKSNSIINETKEEIKKTIKDKLKFDSNKQQDPFLPPRAKDEKSSQKNYFNSKVIKEIDIFRDKKVTTTIKNLKNKDFTPESNENVVSFGKLFINTIIPAIVDQKTCDEVQVFFYALNEQCGPISGQSIAEFPIDVRRIQYEYKDMIENNLPNGGDVTIEEFFRMVVSSQFNDNRAIGYGMTDYYEPYNPDSDQKNNPTQKGSEEEFKRKQLDWMAEYGALKQPVIEMYVETGQAFQTDELGKYDIFDRLRKSQKDLYIESTKTREPNSTNGVKIIKRIHVYDKQNNPYQLLTQVMRSKDEWSVATVDTGKLDDIINAAKSQPGIGNDAQKIRNYLVEQAKKNNPNLKFDPTSPSYEEQILESLSVVQRPGGALINIKGDKKAVRDAVTKTAPNIIIGANGSMVTNATLASKTDGMMAAANIVNLNKGDKKSGAATTQNGISNPNGLPLRMVPAQLTMASKGCPIASLYQQYFIDFNTGTTIDNLYNCTQLQHIISPGKFDTNWVFAFTDGYGKFSGAPTMSNILTGEIQRLTEENPGNTAKAAAIQAATGKKPNGK
jgi:hypothetical protein